MIDPQLAVGIGAALAAVLLMRRPRRSTVVEPPPVIRMHRTTTTVVESVEISAAAWQAGMPLPRWAPQLEQGGRP